MIGCVTAESPECKKQVKCAAAAKFGGNWGKCTYNKPWTVGPTGVGARFEGSVLG